MNEEKIKRCSNCQEIITNETWFECHDNYLEYKYFDTEEENIFCSQECFCKYMSLEEMEEEDEKYN